MQLLVTGGAGYIGSHFCAEWFRQTGKQPVVYDNLSTGHSELVKFGPLILGDILETELLAKTISLYEIDAVVHFAGKAIVSESVRSPNMYHRNNHLGTQSLLAAMKRVNCRRLVFSSSCTVYGETQDSAFRETDQLKPVIPYGHSKASAEDLIVSACLKGDLKASVLRYFNVAGQDTASGLYERHNPETHLLPNVIRNLLKKEEITIYGRNHATRDGTCIRDFIDVRDVAKVHFSVLTQYLDQPIFVSNLGTGRSLSLLEIVSACEQVTGLKAKIRWEDTRPGDVPHLVAETSFFKSWYNQPMLELEKTIESIVAC